ncbi:MAG: aminotransferase class V-fold PLP-dependent enzyme [Oscillospiraceae bacterium]|nr:aminotransferase class V-fold PLP-dependent enzyme [Oscillospiraceae bacterium]
MPTPIVDFCEKYKANEILRAHMPGHKGRGEDFYAFDITEISGADSLFEASGIIRQSEEMTAALFGAYKTLYSAGGSTLCIQTMLAMLSKVTGSKTVVAARNCHRAFVNACGILGLTVKWVLPRYEHSLVTGEISAEEIKALLDSLPPWEKPCCVYITSPDYMGKIAPVSEIARICREKDIFLAVDNAHGAYLKFCSEDIHPLTLGADICCDSAHKTLPALTGAAYLHIKNPALEPFEGFAKGIMSCFASTSPSYLILQSLDRCGEYLRNEMEDIANSANGGGYFCEMENAANALKERLKNAWQIYGDEAGKLSIFAPPSGYSGTGLGEALRQRGVECEYADDCFTVLMLTGLTVEEIGRLGDIFESIPQPRILVQPPDYSNFSLPPAAMGIREAMMSRWEQIPTTEAEGRIAAACLAHCPPGVSAIASGEIFTEEIIKILKNYSIRNVIVV